MIQGIVYRAYCDVTKKSYIGLTIQGLKKRKRRHFDDAFNRESHTHFARALRKYGKKSFEWSVLEEISHNKKEVLLECLKTLEVKYIQLYDSYQNGYNSTPGGDYITDCSKCVKVFNETGEFIRQFDSRREASKYYGISEDCVSAGCNRRQQFSLIQGKRIIFRNEEDDMTEADISKLKECIHNPSCKVLAFEWDTGNPIQTFDTIKEGAKFFKLKSSSPITEIVNGNPRRKTAGKYNGHKVGWTKLVK